ncbi:MAG: lamin tail domain-containing protein [bacterium]|nr:lamin tail domain-containing protein [bacterium]
MVFILAFLFGLFPSLITAQQAVPVVINEIAWMGSSVEKVDANQHWRYEWLELYGEQSANLNGWSIELYRGEELYFQIALSGSIEENGYMLIGASDKIPGVTMSYANLGGKFLNDGMKVVLKDALLNIVDEVDAKNGWPAGENKSRRTMERKEDLSADEAEWQTSAVSGGTPKAKNSEGFKEPIPEVFSFASKKDPAGSFSKESVFSLPVGLALLLAFGSGAGILGLRHLLSRQSSKTFGAPRD